MVSSMIRRPFLVSLVAVSVACVASFAEAQPWPAKPIRFLVAAPAGSSLDTLARIIGERLKDRVGQPIIVENKPAAGGTVATAKRFPLLPGLPTIAEAGHAGFQALAWYGVLVPAGTPKPVIARLNAGINAILREPDVVLKMHAAGFDLIGGTPEDFGSLIQREVATWTPVIRKLGLKVD